MRLLDLFCGAGGAAMGYNRAGFDEVVGIDNMPQPRYPFEFVQADALEYLAEHGHEFDVIHASPPCQEYSVLKAFTTRKHPQLVGVVRDGLLAAGKPYVIENVPGAPLQNPILLCGTMFGLNVIRHRLFESRPVVWFPPYPCAHRSDNFAFDHGGKQPERVYADAMGCNWMTVMESRQAIPPAYTEWLGEQILRQIQ